jgi:hypothetical protein
MIRVSGVRRRRRAGGKGGSLAGRRGTTVAEGHGRSSMRRGREPN